jgi:hypothetical protein
MPKVDPKLREALLDYLDHPRTHASFANATKDFPEDRMNKKLPNVPYTPWGLLEHIRITQHDMVDFMQNSNYHGMKWPQDYWPDTKQEADKAMWNASVRAYEADTKSLKAIVQNPKSDLLVRIPWGEGQTMMREVMQIIDHNGYHIGELVLMRRIMGSWGKA